MKALNDIMKADSVRLLKKLAKPKYSSIRFFMSMLKRKRFPRNAGKIR